MGESTEFWKISKRLAQALDQCEPEHIFRGTIFEFDSVNPVPKERLAKGMLVDRKEGMRRVNFYAGLHEGSGVNSSFLNVGDKVIILGKKHALRDTATFPLLIVLPEKQMLLLSQTPDDNRWGAPGDTGLAVLYLVISILSIPIYFISPIFFPTLQFSVIPLAILFVWLMVLFLGIVWYQKYIRRERVLQFDPDGWVAAVTFVRNRLPVEVSSIFNQ